MLFHSSRKSGGRYGDLFGATAFFAWQMHGLMHAWLQGMTYKELTLRSGAAKWSRCGQSAGGWRFGYLERSSSVGRIRSQRTR